MSFRPVSLLTSIYKLLTKVLATRVKPVQSTTVPSLQTEIVANRKVIDTILIANSGDERHLRIRKGSIIFTSRKLERGFHFLDQDSWSKRIWSLFPILFLLVFLWNQTEDCEGKVLCVFQLCPTHQHQF